VSTTLDRSEAIRAVLPGGEELAEAVAAALHEPVETVRPAVLVGSITLAVALASEDSLSAAIDAERARVRDARGPIRPAPILNAASLDALLAEADRLDAAGRLDLDAVVAIQRTVGAVAAGVQERLVLVLARYGTIRRVTWGRAVAAMREGRLTADDLASLGGLILLWNELTSLVVTDGFRAAERELLARDADARRAALEELLGVIAADPVTAARLRRVASRFGLDPERSYRLVVIALHPEADPTPEQPGIDETDIEDIARRIGHLAGSTAPGAEGAGSGIRLPAVVPLRGQIAVIVRHDWAGFTKLPSILDSVLGPPDGAWVATGSPPLEGVTSLAAAYADLLDATRTALGIGIRGWLADPGSLAVERLLLASRELGDAAVARELGLLLADERLGTELVETLQVYFDAGENMRETARRLHLANRTVAYRLEKIEALLGGPLDDARRRRVAVALMVARLRST
jgi:DNA-binding PucR family transcriptional regulator